MTPLNNIITSQISFTHISIHIQQLSLFNQSRDGLHLFRGAIPSAFENGNDSSSSAAATTQVFSFGRAFLAIFDDALCAR